MNVRAHTLWKVPVFSLASGCVSYYVTVFLGGFFFAATSVGADGVTEISVDSIRSAIFSGVLFLAVLLLGGLWCLRSMSRKEIAISAAIASAIYLAVVLAQLLVPDFPLDVSMTLAVFQNWTAILGSCLFQLIGQMEIALILCCFAPFLFVPFGRKCK